MSKVIDERKVEEKKLKKNGKKDDFAAKDPILNKVFKKNMNSNISK